jgi:hypothetical protein
MLFSLVIGMLDAILLRVRTGRPETVAITGFADRAEGKAANLYRKISCQRVGLARNAVSPVYPRKAPISETG